MTKDKYIYASIFFALALILSTPNYSVVVIALFSLFSIYSLTRPALSISMDRADKIIIVSAISYFVAFIPTAILEGTTLRYFDAPLRFLICIPIYLQFKVHLQHKNASLAFRKSLEYGAISGSIGAFILAIYQSQILNMPQVEGFLFSINFGYLSCALAFLCLVFYRSSTHKMLNMLGFICAVIACVLTLCRGAIIAIPVLMSITLFYLYKDKLNLLNIFLFVLLFAGGSIASYQLSPKIKDRIDYTVFEAKNIYKGNTVKALSVGGRIELWHGAFDAFKESPIIGKTYAQREAINQALYDSGKDRNPTILVKRGHAHNQYFEILASAGIIGIIALFSYLLLPGIYYYYLFKKDNTNIYALNGFIFTLGFWIYCMTEVPLEANSISSFYAFIQALLLALSLYHQKKIEP